VLLLEVETNWRMRKQEIERRMRRTDDGDEVLSAC
jgi:hypothetical protein